MRRVAFRAVAVVIAIAIVAIGVELLANVYLYVHDGRYIPARSRLDTLTNTFTASLTRQHEGCRCENDRHQRRTEANTHQHNILTMDDVREPAP